MKRFIAVVIALSMVLRPALAVEAVGAEPEASPSQGADMESLVDIVAKLWWLSGCPVGEIPLGQDVQAVLVSVLLNEGRIPQVRDMTWQPDMSRYAITEADMALLLTSLAADQAADVEYLKRSDQFTYENGSFVGPYAAGELAVYYPAADITGASASHGVMTLTGFLHMSVNIDQAKTFYKFEAVLKQNSRSVFSGWSVASVTVRDLDRTVRDITASSVLASQAGNSYEPSMAFDQDHATAWVEGAAGTGLGSSITFTFSGPETVWGVSVLPGYWKDPDVYAKNGRPTALEISFSDGTRQSMDLPAVDAQYALAEESYEYVLFDRPVETSFVTLTITGAVPGTVYEDTCITEIQLLK